MARNNKKFDRVSVDYSSYSTLGKVFYWVDPATSGVSLFLGLVLLVSLSCFSLLSVLAYLGLSFVMFGIGSKVYVHLMGMLKKPCKDPLAQLAVTDTTLSEEKVGEWVQWSATNYNTLASELRSLLLAENLYSSVKFGLCLYLATFVGAIFNTLTLFILAWVGAFILPKVYEGNQEPMDELCAKITEQYQAVDAKIAALLPGQAKKEVAAEEKAE